MTYSTDGYLRFGASRTWIQDDIGAVPVTTVRVRGLKLTHYLHGIPADVYRNVLQRSALLASPGPTGAVA